MKETVKILGVHFSYNKKLEQEKNFQRHIIDTENVLRPWLMRNLMKVRSSTGSVLWKKVLLKNFLKFTGKHLCQSLFLNKVEGLKTATLLKKRQAQVFSCEFCEIFKNIFSQSTSGWMPLQGFIFWIFSNLQNSPSITYKNGTTCNN